MSTPTLPSPTSPDDDLEARLRAAFADRASDVGAEDLDPGLPHGVRIPIDEGTDLPGRGRVGWVAIAAAAAVVVAGLGLALQGGDDGATTTATSPPSPTTTVPRAPVFDSLPLGVDPAHGEPLFVTGVHSGPSGGGRDPDAIAEAASAVAMGEALAWMGQVTQPMPTDLGLDADTRDAFYAPLTDADPAVWGAAADPNERGGVVVARPAPGGGWGVVAVTSEVIDLAGVVRDGGRLRGEVRVSVGAPVRVVVSRARSDGASPREDDEIATSDLTTHAGSGLAASVLSLDDPSGEHGGGGIDVGDGPIVVQVEVGDRPGQVGLDGVGVAALAAVGIPGVDGTPVGHPSGGATTTAPDTTQAVAGVAPEPMWQPVPDRGSTGDAAEVAGLFVAEVLGEQPASVGRPSGLETTTEPGPWEGTTDAQVPLASGVVLRVVVAQDADGWSVVQVGDGGVEVSTSGGTTSVDGGPPLGSDAESYRYVVLRRVDEAWSVGRGRMPIEPGYFDALDAVVVVVVDDLGRVIGAAGNAVP